MKKPSWRAHQAWALMVLAAMLVVTGLAAANFFLLRQIGVGGEFLLPWKAARAFMFENIEPFSNEVSGFVQEQVYGRPARPGEDHYYPNLPFHLLLLFLPSGLFRDPVLPGALWLLLCQASLAGFLVLSLRLTDWQPRLPFMAAFLLCSTLSVYTLIGLIENSPIFLLGLLYAGIMVCLRNQMDELAGALAALAFTQWEIGLLFMFFVLRRAYDEKRWRVLAGFAMLTSILGVVAYFLYPDWVWSFPSAVVAGWRNDYGFTPGALFSSLWPAYSGYLRWGLTAILSAVLIAEWSLTRRAEFRRFYWAACLTLAITPLIGFRMEPEFLVVLVMPLALIISVIRERWLSGYWLASLFLVMISLIPWGLVSGAGLTQSVRHGILMIFFPALTVIGLYWIRWWAFRPPRTWLERAANAEFR